MTAPTTPRTGSLLQMREALDRLWRLYHTPQGLKLFRYTMTSVISTIVSAAVLFFVFGVLHLWSEVPSTVFGNAVATFPSYWLNRTWAWGKTGRSHLAKEVLPFWIISAAGIAFSILGAQAARHLGHSWHLGHAEQTGVVVFANIASFGIFWILKLLIYNRLFHHHPVLEAEVEAHLVET